MVYKCKMCKGDLVIINEENGLCECDSCGSRQTVPLENDERKAEFYKMCIRDSFYIAKQKMQ